MRAITCIAMLMLATPALASGGFSCEADDAAAKFTIEAGLSRGAGNGLFNFRGELELRGKDVAEDFRKSVFEPANLMQHWIDGKDLRLELYRERSGDKPFAELTLLIEAVLVEEGSYAGPYSLRLMDMTGDTSGEGRTITLDGKTTCFVE